MKETISKIISERQAFWKTYQDSWDDSLGDHGEYTMEEPKEIDEMGNKIYDLIIENSDDLSVDFIIESLTMLGQAPQIVYDDNGNFAVSGSGFNPVVMEDDGKHKETISISAIVEPEMWKKTIREALNNYLENFK